LSIQKVTGTCNLMAATEQPGEKSIDLLVKRNKAGRILFLYSTIVEKPQIPVITAQ
jgi:hypothetical protein